MNFIKKITNNKAYHIVSIIINIIIGISLLLGNYSPITLILIGIIFILNAVIGYTQYMSVYHKKSNPISEMG